MTLQHDLAIASSLLVRHHMREGGNNLEQLEAEALGVAVDNVLTRLRRLLRQDG